MLAVEAIMAYSFAKFTFWHIERSTGRSMKRELDNLDEYERSTRTRIRPLIYGYGHSYYYSQTRTCHVSGVGWPVEFEGCGCVPARVCDI